MQEVRQTVNFENDETDGEKPPYHHFEYENNNNPLQQKMEKKNFEVVSSRLGHYEVEGEKREPEVPRFSQAFRKRQGSKFEDEEEDL